MSTVSHEQPVEGNLADYIEALRKINASAENIKLNEGSIEGDDGGRIIL